METTITNDFLTQLVNDVCENNLPIDHFTSNKEYQRIVIRCMALKPILALHSKQLRELSTIDRMDARFPHPAFVNIYNDIETGFSNKIANNLVDDVLTGKINIQLFNYSEAYKHIIISCVTKKPELLFALKDPSEDVVDAAITSSNGSVLLNSTDFLKDCNLVLLAKFVQTFVSLYNNISKDSTSNDVKILYNLATNIHDRFKTIKEQTHQMSLNVNMCDFKEKFKKISDGQEKPSEESLLSLLEKINSVENQKTVDK